MSGPTKSSLLAIAALAIASAATPAAASDLVPALQYRVYGEVSPRCTISQASNATTVSGLQNKATDTVNSTAVDLAFNMACNTPSRVRLSSANGGLRTDAATSDASFTSLVPYRATLSLPGASNALACDSDAMSSDDSSCSREIDETIHDGKGVVRISTEASDKLLLAGTYNDTFTLTVSPRIGDD